jgi:hypothetical protein
VQAQGFVQRLSDNLSGVTAARDDVAMHDLSERPLIEGRHLRWILTVFLFRHRVLTLKELVALVERNGFRVGGRPSKTVSDALRWEIRRDRVIRIGRGRYAAGSMPRSTLSWRRARVRALRAERIGRDRAA